ncbi:MAG: hypothetical protein HEQ39_10000 [Rhizobacter sp.]
MSTTAQSIVLEVQTTLQDVDGVRWTALELLRHINDEQREIVRLRPDVKATTTTMSLVSGSRQLLPAQFMALIDITRNTSGSKRALRKTSMEQLDAVSPAWNSSRPSAEVIHFMHDMREPRTFYVWPPSAGARVELVASQYPSDVPSLGATIDLPDEWKQALIDGVLHRAYAKDAEYGGNAELSVVYLQKRNAALKSQLESTASVAPKT